jgi:hypothetical protein
MEEAQHVDDDAGAEPVGEARGHAGARGRAGRSRGRHPDRPIEEQAEALKERVYATFTGLAIVLVQLSNVEHLTATRATLTLLVGIVAITAAGFAANVLAHLAVHAAFPDGAEFGRMVRIAGSALASAGVPIILLALAAFGVFELEPALRAASLVGIVTLGLIGLVAVLRTHVAWWKQLIALSALMALGLGVILLQLLAHGH